MIDAKLFLVAMLDAAERDPELAARVRKLVGRADDAAWVPLAKLPIARKSARALAASRAFEVREIRGRLYVNVASFEAFMAGRDAKPSNVDADLRAELGLRLVGGGR